MCTKTHIRSLPKLSNGSYSGRNSRAATPNQKEPTLMTESHLATLGQRLDRLER